MLYSRPHEWRHWHRRVEQTWNSVMQYATASLRAPSGCQERYCAAHPALLFGSPKIAMVLACTGLFAASSNSGLCSDSTMTRSSTSCTGSFTLAQRVPCRSFLGLTCFPGIHYHVQVDVSKSRSSFDTQSKHKQIGYCWYLL